MPIQWVADEYGAVVCHADRGLSVASRLVAGAEPVLYSRSSEYVFSSGPLAY